jgi:hypothetical protein
MVISAITLKKLHNTTIIRDHGVAGLPEGASSAA